MTAQLGAGHRALEWPARFAHDGLRGDLGGELGGVALPWL
ncbi:hypothetical protein DGo_CA1527 [Deinococcus gobiensis I-0]|uniref:Uncharacterized protein n=1 Tax=Deinococcus gobiensis (strain DSM 21396 / JCM 16679 / CGMCC 1.7299 / I-0) TaxID=745776 RepID=H8GUD0_DEIGI|nr:hypothetical protein DGo_CA1527 [Deinococcus gobiensis I-0]